MRRLIDIDTLRSLLAYDAETGVLTWRPRPEEMFSSARFARQWNGRFAGAPAMTALDIGGYRTGGILYEQYQAHRVIWAIATGSWPVGDLDHINGVRTDNRLCNLREVTAQENSRNMRRSCKNTSGVLGVYWEAKQRKWRAVIRVATKLVHLGSFTELAAAASARQAANEKYGFHPNHGRG